MLIYTKYNSPRLQYILQELFVRRLGMNYELTHNKQEAIAYNGPKICYDHDFIADSLHIMPHEMLWEDELHNHTVSIKHNHEWDTLFWPQHGEVPFEIFAASFYLLSRYEEYLPHKVDDHGRFDPEQSVAVQYGFLETPLIDRWALKLKEVLERQFGKIECNAPQYKQVSTIDIDTAFLYRGLQNERQLRKTIKSAALLRIDKLAEQLQVIRGNKQDPYDTYDYIQQITQNCTLLYFILCGGESEFDNAISIKTEDMQTLLQKLAVKYTLGIHPSYHSYDNGDLMATEKQELEKCIAKTVTKSRQHYLRFRLPQTMNLLIQKGITEDYSMAYSGLVGFRASTCFPFYFFDLEQNCQTSLLLYPTAVMDVTLRFNMNLTISSALTKVEQLMQEVKQVNGCFISIWHNNNLSITDNWHAWREVFEKIHSPS